MNRKAAIPLVMGLVIGLVAVKLVMDSVKRAQGSSQAQQKFTVVQAKVDIGAFEEVGAEMVQPIEISDSALAPPQERISGVELVVGRVTAKPIPQNAPILQSMLAPEGTKARMVGQIQPGYRAVSVKIDETTSAGYNMQPGDWVDVIVVMDLDTGARGKKETIAEVILQHVQVAAIGQGTSNEADQAGGKVKPAKSATLLVKEEDAPKLHLAATRGKITLAMRGEDDKLMTQPAVAYSSEISGESSPKPELPAPTPTTPAPRPRPVQIVEAPQPLPHTVFVYRGTNGSKQSATAVERITFESAHSANILEVSMGNPTRASATMSPVRARPRSAVNGATPNNPASNANSDAMPADHEENVGDFPFDEDSDGPDDNNERSQAGGE